MTKHVKYSTPEEKTEAYRKKRNECSKKWYQSLKTDPEKMEARNARQREFHRVKREKEGVIIRQRGRKHELLQEQLNKYIELSG